MAPSLRGFSAQKAEDMTAPTTSAIPKIALDQRAPSRHDNAFAFEVYASGAAIIASSTSGLLPSVMVADLARPERFLVAHPLTPPHLLPITEVCPSPLTSPAALSATLGLIKRVGQRPPLLKKEIAGFVLNRVLGAMMNELR